MPTRKPARANSSPAVQTILQAPPAEWALHAGGYCVGYDDTYAGRLVRLADVVRWLMQTMPRPHAAERVCAALEQARPQPQLFLVKPNDYAAPAPADALYGGCTEAMLVAAKAQGKQDAMQSALKQERRGRFDGSWQFGSSAPPTWPEPVEPGLPAAIRCMRSVWGSPQNRDAVLDRRSSPIAALAVRLSDAAALWGYGVATAAAAQGQDAIAQPLGINGKVWTDEKLRRLLTDHCQLKGAGEKAYTKKLAEQHGVGETTIKTRLRKARELVDLAPRNSKSPATPFSGLMQRAK